MKKIMFKINYSYKTNNQKFNNYNKNMQIKLKNLRNYQMICNCNNKNMNNSNKKLNNP